jgi:AcrR family transcriptional regulator
MSRMTRPGRKRSEESRQAILTAAAGLVAEVGYAGLSIEGIAARSGTGKQTIYRWWPSKADVLLEALAETADLHIPVADEGSYAADLRAFLTASFALGRKPQVIEVLRALMAESQINPDFGVRFRAGFLVRRREALGVLVERARTRGDLPPVPRPATIADLVFGLIWYRVLATRDPIDDAQIDELVTLLTNGATTW